MTATLPAAPAATLRIAIAYDDRDVCDFLQRFLPLLGHTVNSVAGTGKELVDQCRQSPPDLIVADIKMPDMTGLEAVEAIARSAEVPTILVTGHAVPAWLEKAKDLGVMAYLVKPVTEHDLAPAIALARRHFEELQTLRKESAELRQALDDRKLIERAKGSVGRRVGDFAFAVLSIGEAALRRVGLRRRQRSSTSFSPARPSLRRRRPGA